MKRFLWVLIFVIIFIGVLSALRFNASLSLEYIKVLIWPSIVTWVLWISRKSIPKLIERIVRIKAMGNEVEFTQMKDDQGKLPKDGTIKAINDKKATKPATQTALAMKELEELGLVDKKTHKILSSAEACLEYERIYRILFGTQLQALRRLVANLSGLEPRDLQDLIEKHEELSRGHGFHTLASFLEYMKGNNLVLYNDKTHKYHVTNAGVYFLTYLLQEGLIDRYKDW